MNEAAAQQDAFRWVFPAMAGAIFAVDPAGLKGVVLRAQPGPVRDCWLRQLRQLLPANTPWRRIPAHIGDDRLLGGLDLSATLRAGRPVSDPGLLVESRGGVVSIAMAERLEPGIAARLAAVLDNGEVALERAGISRRTPVSLGMIALDEGIGEEEAAPKALADRFAIYLSLEGIGLQDMGAPQASPDAVLAARERLPRVRVEAELIATLCQAALQFGIDSLRMPLLAVKAARAAAALRESSRVDEDDIALAAQLVLAGRATQLPPLEEDEPEPEPEQETPEEQADCNQENEQKPEDSEQDNAQTDPQTLRDQVLEATRAVIPPELMQQLQYASRRRNSAQSSARSITRRRPAKRGRRIGTRPGEPGTGTVLNLVETLRVAAPWQNLRKRESVANETARAPVIRLSRDDFRINRYQQRSAMTTVFVVDASGSSALHRLAEAKGAVELLLAQSYQRRDRVALVAFRGEKAELLLAPTRSLVRAKRNLAGLPGGGGTPLAAGIQLALETALGVRRSGETPVIILLTDGRANVGLDGRGGRKQAESEAFESARAVRAEEITALLVDTSPRPRPLARQLAEAMAANYLALPHADAEGLTVAARSLSANQPQGQPRP